MALAPSLFNKVGSAFGFATGHFFANRSKLYHELHEYTNVFLLILTKFVLFVHS